MTIGKLIREARMGVPKTWKSGAVISTYPTPMLVFQGDAGGMDILVDPKRLPINWIDNDPVKLKEWCLKPITDLPPVSCVQFANQQQESGDKIANILLDTYVPTPDDKSFPRFNQLNNILLTKGMCPWRTVVYDPITALNRIVLGHFSVKNPSKMDDARKWAGSAGLKVQNTLTALATLPCHVVFILHAINVETKDNDGKLIDSKDEPVLMGQYRDLVGMGVSQFFYAGIDHIAGKKNAYVRTVPNGKVNGLGCRWPANLPDKLGATFDAIYGESVKKGECAI